MLRCQEYHLILFNYNCEFSTFIDLICSKRFTLCKKDSLETIIVYRFNIYLDVHNKMYFMKAFLKYRQSTFYFLLKIIRIGAKNYIRHFCFM
ncbi:hypothetical protein C0J52_25347 [Blattella germanica]|nr:hypothetical protein C0J52_25347 [Blattella germanica]